MAVSGVAATVAGDPLFDSGAIKGSGIEAHGFGIGEDAGEIVRIGRGEFAQNQAWSFEDMLGLRNVLALQSSEL
jgi:hypothetical protein